MKSFREDISASDHLARVLKLPPKLILGSGTAAQKEKWLPKIASGEVLPTAGFLRPNTRFGPVIKLDFREGNVYRVYGNKNMDYPSGAR